MNILCYHRNRGRQSGSSVAGNDEELESSTEKARVFNSFLIYRMIGSGAPVLEFAFQIDWVRN